jgi:hypothetical protein
MGVSSGGEQQRFCVSRGCLAPVSSDLLLPDAVLQTHGCPCLYYRCRTTIVMAPLSRSACIDKGPG